MNDRPDRVTLPAEALSDAEAMPWLDDLVRGGLICLMSLFMALVVAAVPLPLVAFPSLAEVVIGCLSRPLDYIITDPRPGEGFRIYWHVCLLLAVVFTQPVLLRHLFDVISPRQTPRRNLRMAITIVTMLTSFALGIVMWVAWMLPALLAFLVEWSPYQSEVQWDFVEYVETTTTLAFTTGAAFELPALVVGLVWLHAVSRDRLAKWHPYAILAAFIVGALVTPTSDMLNQAIVALPICLLYELGLLLARLLPADPPSSSFPSL